MGWTRYVEQQEQAENATFLHDLVSDLDYLSGEFPEMAEKAQSLQTDILAAMRKYGYQDAEDDLGL